MTADSRIGCPGKSCGRCARMISSSSTNATPVRPRRVCTSRVRPDGNLDDREAVIGFPRRGVQQHGDIEAERRQQRKRSRRRQSQAVSAPAGRHRVKNTPSEARCASLKSAKVSSRIPWAARAGSNFFDGQPVQRLPQRHAPARRWPRAAGRASGRRGRARCRPSATACLRPATRTMKNSSRFDAAIAANLTRSSSGTVASAASSSTRSLKASHDSSRLMKRLAVVGVRRRHPTTPAGRMTSCRPNTSTNMSARAVAAICSIVMSPVPCELQHPGLFATHQVQVPDLLQVLGVERVGDTEDRRQLVDDEAVLAIERDVRQMAVLRHRPPMIARDVGDDGGFLVGQAEDLRRGQQVLGMLVMRAQAHIDSDVVQQAAVCRSSARGRRGRVRRGARRTAASASMATWRPCARSNRKR